jgi:hypothetical protein
MRKTQQDNLQDQFERDIAFLVTCYRRKDQKLKMARIVSGLENAKRSAEENGEV